MRTIAVKLDDFVLDMLTQEARERQITRMELIRSAIVNFLVNRGDAADLRYIEAHKKGKLLSFEETFS